jgi:hypothetical protein
MKRVSPWFLLVLVSAFAVTGCSKASAPASARAQEATGGAPAVAAPSDGAPKAEKAAGDPAVRRMFEVTAELDATVSDGKARDALVQTLSREAANAGGYVGQAEANGSVTTLVLRIPAKDIERFERMLGDSGKVSRRTLKSVDVTEAVLDVEARLRAARAEEDRLLKLLSDRTGSLTDVLAVERSLSDVRSRIEQFEAQERSQKSRVALATVTMRLSADAPAQEEGFAATARDAASDGVHAVRVLGQTAVLVTLRAGPTLLVLGLFVMAILRAVRFGLRKRNAAAQGTSSAG